MPMDYMENLISRNGVEGTLTKHTANEPDFNDRLRTVKTTTISTTSEKFMYVDETIEQRVQHGADGWENRVDKIIWVFSTLDIGTRDNIDSDTVALDNGRNYRVEHVTSRELFRLTYKRVGLKEINKDLV